MRTVAPKVETVEQPIEFLDGQDNRFVAGLRRHFEALGFQALEPEAEAVALPVQHFDPITRLVEEDEEHGVEHGDFDIQFYQGSKAVDGLSKVHRLGVEVDFFDFAVGAHHAGLAPEGNREHSIGHQVSALNVGFMEHLQLIYLFAGQYEHAGILGEIIVKADQASVAQELGGNPDRALAAPKQSLQRQLADGLRFLVKDKFKLNQPSGPSDGWLTQDALWLVSKPAADQLRAYLLAQGIEGVPSSNAPFFNMLQDQAVIQTNAEDKAIWTATVDNGAGWRNKFTLLKIAPALIWTDAAERPSPYSGSLVVEDGTASTEKPETTCEIPNEPAEQQQAPETKMTLHQPAPSVAKPSNEMRAIAEPSTDDQEETDDLYALLGNITSPSEELDTSHDSPAASPTNTRGEENLQQPLGNKEPTDCAPEAVEDVFMPSRSTDLGQGFVGWMKSGIATRRLFINDTKALVHTVDGTAMLVTPGIFKRYVQEHPELEKLAQAKDTTGWKLVQRAFEKQGLHRKTSKNLNIWTIKVSGPRKTKELKAYLLQDPKLLFPEQPLDNPSLTVITDAEGGVE